jgi:hypothetical protein
MEQVLSKPSLNHIKRNLFFIGKLIHKNKNIRLVIILKEPILLLYIFWLRISFFSFKRRIIILDGFVNSELFFDSGN